MRAAGLVVREDDVGNLIGRLAGPRPRAKILLLGSHLDTVRDAGRFDGPLGVLLPLAALAEVRRRGKKLPFAVEVLGFSEEEGVRFGSAYLGSKGYAGTLRKADLALRDAGGRSVADVLAEHHARKVSRPARAHRPRDLLGYLEVHIEQGPVLEQGGFAVGVVSAIVGQTRGTLSLRGQAGHAGTTPMPLRRDALAGAAECILLAETLARRPGSLRATVGTISVTPGAPNVIPGEATLSFDVRHPRDAARRTALREFRTGAERIARTRGLRCEWRVTQDGGAVTCDPALTKILGAAVRSVQGTTPSLVSGAGHDAVAMSALTPVAMLFVRCRQGLSHHPDEYASPADIRVALTVLIEAIERLADRE